MSAGHGAAVRPRRPLALATAFTCVFMMGFALSNSMYGTLLPRIIEQYALSLKQASALAVACLLYTSRCV